VSFKKIILAIILLYVIVIFFFPPGYTTDDPERPVEITQAEIDFAIDVLDAAQIKSIQNNREYCGYIGLNSDNEFVATRARRGSSKSCRPSLFFETFTVLASYHTHGSYSENYHSELPSDDDLKSDIEEGVDGYVSTPGGRVWFSDSRKKLAYMICPENCVLSDENYKPDTKGSLQKRYTLDELINYFSR